MTTQIDDSQVGAKLRALSQGVRVFVLEQGYRYVVPSSADDGTAYELIVRDDGISCTCLGALHGRTCKHVGAVSLRMQAEEQIWADR